MAFESQFGGPSGRILTLLCFLGGGILATMLDRLIPDQQTNLFFAGAPGARTEEAALTAKGQPGSRGKLVRLGLVSAIALTLHNFPEGIATFMGGFADFRLGLPIALAVAIHNIPEGIAVSVPLYYGTGSRSKAFLYTAISGLSEPLGAIAAYLILSPFISPALLAGIYACVSGIMLVLSFDELLPAAEKHGKPILGVLGLIAGMIIMSLALFVLG